MRAYVGVRRMLRRAVFMMLLLLFLGVRIRDERWKGIGRLLVRRDSGPRGW
jgi:hypothetical protein